MREKKRGEREILDKKKKTRERERERVGEMVTHNTKKNEKTNILKKRGLSSSSSPVVHRLSFLRYTV